MAYRRRRRYRSMYRRRPIIGRRRRLRHRRPRMIRIGYRM